MTWSVSAGSRWTPPAETAHSSAPAPGSPPGVAGAAERNDGNEPAMAVADWAVSHELPGRAAAAGGQTLLQWVESGVRLLVEEVK
jgi:hypothetical protein